MIESQQDRRRGRRFANAHDSILDVDRFRVGTPDVRARQGGTQGNANVLRLQFAARNSSEHRGKEQVVTLAHEGYLDLAVAVEHQFEALRPTDAAESRLRG
jgi:hypothetical protein